MLDADLAALDATLDRSRSRMAVVHLALTLGPVAFLGVVVYLWSVTTPGDQPPKRELLDLLSLVHAGLLLTLVPLGLLVLPKILLGRAVRGASGAHFALRVATAVEGACILRMALVEGPALFGTVVVLLAVLQGALQEQPLYWANTASTAVLLVASVLAFPTRGRLSAMVRRALSGA